MTVTALLRQPLLHFLLAGAAIFIFNSLSNPDTADSAAEDPRRIVVDQATLLDFMQYRAQAFEPEYFAAQLAALPEAELDTLVGDYVREEALYREALAMGMADLTPKARAS